MKVRMKATSASPKGIFAEGQIYTGSKEQFDGLLYEVLDPDAPKAKVAPPAAEPEVVEFVETVMEPKESPKPKPGGKARKP